MVNGWNWNWEGKMVMDEFVPGDGMNEIEEEWWVGFGFGSANEFELINQ
jgi:hypothetical protein